VAARARDVLGAPAEVVEDLLPLGHLGDGQRDTGGPGADDVLDALGVDRLLGAPGGASRLGLVVARDVLDGLTLDLHSALVQGQLHPPVEDGPDVGEGAGEGPEPQHRDLPGLGPEHGGEAKTGHGAGAGQGQDVATRECAHRGSSALMWGWVAVHADVVRGENRSCRATCQVGRPSLIGSPYPPRPMRDHLRWPERPKGSEVGVR
jgi:hypothetical protein